MAFSAIGCNWRSQETSISGIYGYLGLTSKFDVNLLTMKTTSNLSYFGSSMVIPHFWNQKNQPSHRISLHKELTFGFRNSAPFSSSKMLHIETVAGVVQPFGFGVSISQIHWILSAIHRSITRVAVENPQIPSL